MLWFFTKLLIPSLAATLRQLQSDLELEVLVTIPLLISFLIPSTLPLATMTTVFSQLLFLILLIV